MTPGLTITELGGGVPVVLTDVRGGRSTGECASLNLSLMVDDDPHHVLANRRAVARQAGYDPGRLVVPGLVHGSTVTAVDERHAGRGAIDQADCIPSSDALITDTPQLPLMVMVADCAPVVLVDPVRPAIGIAHAGWRGAAAKVVQQTVAALTVTFGTDPGLLEAWIGPHIGLASFEMGEAEAAECARAFPEAHVVHRDRGPRPHVDLAAMLCAQLGAAGVTADRVTRHAVDTVTDERYFSHRRSMARSGRTSGRFAGIIWLP